MVRLAGLVSLIVTLVFAAPRFAQDASKAAARELFFQASDAMIAKVVDHQPFETSVALEEGERKTVKVALEPLDAAASVPPKPASVPPEPAPPKPLPLLSSANYITMREVAPRARCGG